MVNRLRAMQAAAPDIEASAIVSVDGLIMASALPAEVEEDRVSAMSAAMLSLGERIAGELGRGGLEQVYIKGDAGFIVLTSVGTEAVLTTLARQEAKLGLNISRNAPGRRRPGQVGRMIPSKKKPLLHQTSTHVGRTPLNGPPHALFIMNNSHPAIIFSQRKEGSRGVYAN